MSRSEENVQMQRGDVNQFPHDEILEQSVLGGIMINPGCYLDICTILKEEMFYEKFHAAIYSAIRKLDSEGKGVDLFTVSEKMKEEGSFSGDIMSRLAYLTKQVVTTANIIEYALILKNLYLRREVIKFGFSAQQMAYDKTVSVEEMLQKVDEEMFSLTVDNTRDTISGMIDMVPQAILEIEEASQRKGLSGIECGLYDLDQRTRGLQKSNLVVLAARPAMGKTALLLSMAKNMADNQHPVLIFSLEMSKSELMQRLISNATELPVAKIQNSSKLSKGDWLILQNQLKNLQNIPLFIDDVAYLTVYEMMSKARRMVKEHKIECIFVDYLQLMKAEGKFSNREQEVSTISRSLKQLAKELNIPVIALSQLNRGVEARSGENKRPVLSDLRESGAIEQDADLVFLLHRPEYYDIKTDEMGNSTAGLAELIVAKNRNGSTGTVKLKFEGQLMKFTDYEDEFTVPSRYSNIPSAPQPDFMDIEEDEKEFDD